MKKLVIVFFSFLSSFGFAQIDKDQLSLDISKADAANTDQLKSAL